MILVSYISTARPAATDFIRCCAKCSYKKTNFLCFQKMLRSCRALRFIGFSQIRCWSIFFKHRQLAAFYLAQRATSSMNTALSRARFALGYDRKWIWCQAWTAPWRNFSGFLLRSPCGFVISDQFAWWPSYVIVVAGCMISVTGYVTSVTGCMILAKH
jgi:hypothetical protein